MNNQRPHIQYAIKDMAEYITVDEALTRLPRKIIREYDQLTLKSFASDFIDDLPPWVLSTDIRATAVADETCQVSVDGEVTKWGYVSACQQGEESLTSRPLTQCDYIGYVGCIDGRHVYESEAFTEESEVTYYHHGSPKDDAGIPMILKTPNVLVTALIAYVRYRIAQDSAVMDIRMYHGEEVARVTYRRERLRALSAVRQRFHSKASRSNPIA